MKEIIREIIKTPVILFSVLLMLTIYGLLCANAIRRNKELFIFSEKLCIRFLIFCQSQVGVTPFIHWSTSFLILPPLNATIAYSQIFIYSYIAFVFFPKIAVFVQTQFSKNFIHSVTKNPFFWALSILTFVSFTWSDTPFIAFKSGAILLCINLVSLYIATQFDWGEIFGFIRWNLGAIALLSFVIRKRTNAGTTEGGGGLAGVLPSKNTLGGIMALGATLWILHAISSPKDRSISIFMSFVCLLIFLQAKSGGAYFLFIILISVALLSRFIKLFSFKLATVMMAGLVVSIVLGSFLVVFNIESILGAIGKDLSFTGRNLVWPAVLQAASKRIWLGYGVFSFWQPWRGEENPALIHWTANKHWVPPSAHQGFLDILLQLGIVGLTMLVFSLCLNFVHSLRYFLKHQGVASILPLIVVLHQVLSNLPETRFLRPNAFWVTYIIISIKLSLPSNSSSLSKLDSYSSANNYKVL